MRRYGMRMKPGRSAPIRDVRCAAALLALPLTAALLCAASPAGAQAAIAPAPALSLQAVAQPTSLISGEPDDEYELLLTNSGGAPSTGPVTITDTLPGALTTSGAATGNGPGEGGEWNCPPAAGLTVLTCTLPGPIRALGHAPAITVPVTVPEGIAGPLLDQASATGGGAPAATTTLETSLNAAAPPFGLASFSTALTGLDGTPDTQAADHPNAFTISIHLNSVVRHGPDGHLEPTSVHDLKDLILDLPPGLLASATATPTCTFAQLASAHHCPSDTQIGALQSQPAGATSISGALYNMVPEHGTAGEFGFTDATGATHALYASLAPSPAGYALRITARELPQIALTDFTATIYGDPAAQDESDEGPLSLLTNPSQCGGQRPATTIHIDSWTAPGAFADNGTPAGEPDLQAPGWVTATSPASESPLTGCQNLRLGPIAFSAKPDTTAADSPTGLSVQVGLAEPQTPTTLATPPLKSITATLPAGLTIDPSAAGGLAACTEAQIGWDGVSLTNFTAAPPACPEASSIGTVEAQTPLIAGTLHGSIYLAAQYQNPLGALIGAYIAIEDPSTGVIVKIAGELRTDPATGQITAVFDQLPQLSFGALKLRFSGGPRALLATPAACATFTTTSSLEAWSAPESGPPATPADSFPISSGCADPFAPALSAGTTPNQAGAFSPLTLTLSRQDGEQHLSGFTVQAPPGLLANLSGVQSCPEPAAGEGSCAAQSQIGAANLTAGVGPNPYPLTGGRVYLTGPYSGGPFGLSIVIPALAGPFDLGTIVVRASIRIDPATGRLSIVTDPLPQMLDSVEGLDSGIPADLRTITLSLDRPWFTFNPTSCEPTSVTATVTSAQGATSTPVNHFQAAGCASLQFKPSVTASTSAHASESAGASLTIRIAYPKGAQGTQAWFREARFDLPRQLPARLSTLQQACLAAVFRANPAACPPPSVIGHAIVHTPLLPVALAGPLYFVSNGGASFPEAVMVLQGDGVTIELHGQTSINNRTHITSAAFSETPDVPFESIEVTLPQGRYSEFGANLPASARGSFCRQKLLMPSLLKAQNGRELRQTTKIKVTGCPKPKKHSKPKQARHNAHRTSRRTS